MTDRNRLIELLSEAHKKFIKSDSVYEFDFFADHLLANGVIVPPCKVGDTVYYLNTRYAITLKKNTIYIAKVVRIVTTYLGTCLVIHIRDDEGGCCEIPDIRDFGKTVFLTKEEAEEKLKELGEMSYENQPLPKRNFDLKRRETEKLPAERLKDILSRIYPEETVNELMDKLIEKRSDNNAI